MVLAIFANQVCLPIPSVVFLMAAGSLSAHGQLQPAILLPLSVVACVAADGIWFWVGRCWGFRPMRLLCALSSNPRICFMDAQKKFQRYGLRLLFVSRFLPGVDGIMPPLAGASNVSTWRFIAFDAPGSLLWAGSYLAIGYVFAGQLDAAVAWTEQFGAAFGILAAIVICAFVGWRAFTLIRMILRLRERHISPSTLARKLESDEKLALLDLVQFEDDISTQLPEVIPGACSLNPLHLPDIHKVEFPKDVEVVLYTSSGNDAVAARTASALEKAGVNSLWVLDGGLKAWREHQLPLSQTPEVPETLAARLGVRLPNGGPEPETLNPASTATQQQ